AVAALAAAGDLERRLPAGMGPPRPIKPSDELAGEVCLELGLTAEARAAFERALARYPKRSLSLLGLARAAAAAGDESGSAAAYAELLENWRDADVDPILIEEARAGAAAPGRTRWIRRLVSGLLVLSLVLAGVAVRRRFRRAPAVRRRRAGSPARARER
ncbi:MAG TPA: tetratricopeptide repeat protein, partial [Vicinamibacterales bacterium]|nr:tetratricopeptide repeat protein [Vicinamibacterales bacterium]